MFDEIPWRRPRSGAVGGCLALPTLPRRGGTGRGARDNRRSLARKCGTAGEAPAVPPKVLRSLGNRNAITWRDPGKIHKDTRE
jgi:hypothetical protein